jgi:hypothetical protein
MSKSIIYVVGFLICVVGCSLDPQGTLGKSRIRKLNDASQIKLAAFEYLIMNKLPPNSVSTIYVDTSKSEYAALASQLTNSNLRMGHRVRDLAEKDMMVVMGGIDISGNKARAVAGLINWSELLFKFDLDKSKIWTITNVDGPIILDRLK